MENKDGDIILVTGGSVWLDKLFNSLCTSKKWKNEKWTFASSKDADLTNLESTQAMFDKYKPTHVIYLVAKVGGLFVNLQVLTFVSHFDFWQALYIL